MAGTVLVDPRCQLNHPREDIATGPVRRIKSERDAAFGMRPFDRINLASSQSHSKTLDHITGSRTALLQKMLGAEYQSLSVAGREPVKRFQLEYKTYAPKIQAPASPPAKA